MQEEEEKQETEETRPSKYKVNVMINPECLDEDGADCPCYRKEAVRKYNPI